MENNNQGPLLQNMAMMQKQQLLSEQQYYDYPSNPNITQYNNYPGQTYTPENSNSNNQEIYVHNSLNEPIMTSLMRDLNRIYAKLKVVALPVASEAKNKELFIVITIAPIHITIKIIEKTNPEFFLVVKHNIVPNKRQIINGPHKSHCLSSLFLASDETGKATIFNFA